MVVKLILRDAVFWMVVALVTVLVGGAGLIKNDRPGSEGSAPLAGAASIPSATDDPAVQAIVNGTFPKVDSQLTLGQAFARYRWFSGQPKWIGRGQPSSRTVLVSVPLKLPGEAAELGVGSGAAMIFYAAEFGLSGDSRSFRPISSAVEVRDGTNKLIARVPDPEFILVRRVMRDVEPGVSLKGGVAKGR
jgi:hypothetical protein